MVSYKTLKNDRAERPPLHTVPGQSDGEYKNEQLAVIRQPRAKPALLSLRSVEGLENRTADAIEATASVMSIIDDAEIDGAVDSITDATTVKIARIVPLTTVMSTSPAEQVSGDAAERLVLPALLRDHGVDPDTGEPAFELDLDAAATAKVGKGGGNTRTEVASAR